MKVNGFIINVDKLAAGVPYAINESAPHLQRVSDRWFVWEVANRLLQRERKAGRIETVHNKLWRQVA